ncbi:MAG: hypothetical protein AB7G13_33680 [Lautropia sp.]
MGRSNRIDTGRQARPPAGRTAARPAARELLAARMSAQFDRALSEAAEAIELLESGWDEAPPADDDGGDFLPLEFQLADLERAVDTMLQERDRFLYGAPADASGRPESDD